MILGVGAVPGGIRTPNLLIRSQLLYPVELQTQLLENPKFQVPNPKVDHESLVFGVGELRSWVVDGTRTRNNQDHNLGLYH